MDKEKVIKGLEHCIRESEHIDDNPCDGCPYFVSDQYGCERTQMEKDALALLEEQEAVEPYMDFDGHDVWRCGKCGATIFHIYHNASDEDAKNYAKFCRNCGKPVKWE